MKVQIKQFYEVTTEHEVDFDGDENQVKGRISNAIEEATHEIIDALRGSKAFPKLGTQEVWDYAGVQYPRTRLFRVVSAYGLRDGQYDRAKREITILPFEKKPTDPK